MLKQTRLHYAVAVWDWEQVFCTVITQEENCWRASLNAQKCFYFSQKLSHESSFVWHWQTVADSSFLSVQGSLSSLSLTAAHQQKSSLFSSFHQHCQLERLLCCLHSLIIKVHVLLLSCESDCRVLYSWFSEIRNLRWWSYAQCLAVQVGWCVKSLYLPGLHQYKFMDLLYCL